MMAMLLEGARGRDAGADQEEPELDPSGPIERVYETRLHDYYGDLLGITTVKPARVLSRSKAMAPRG